MPNYANGKIYCIRNRADGDKIVYVGSTTRPLSERMANHRTSVKVARMQHLKLYTLMETTGVDNFHIELLTDFACQRREQLLQEEGRHIRIHDCIGPGCNVIMAGRTKKESHAHYYECNKEYVKEKTRQYANVNVEKVVEYQKEYRSTNKAEIRDKQKEYRNSDAGKAKIAENAKKYYEENKEKIKQRVIDWQKNNKERVNAKNRAYEARKKNPQPEVVVPDDDPSR